MIVKVLKLEPGPLDTLLKCERLVSYEVITDLEQLLCMRATMLEGRFDIVGFREVRVDALHWLDKQVVKDLAAPLDAMGYRIGETLERAGRSLLFRGILRGGVGLGEMWDDDLSVSLCPESARFE